MSIEKKVVVDELHRPVRINFPRRKYVYLSIGNTLAMDLIDMRALQDENDGYCWILTTICIFSKFALAEPIKSKSGQDVCNAIKNTLERYKYKNYVEKIVVDNGEKFIF